NTQSAASPPSTFIVDTIALADGETADAYLSVEDIDGRTLVLDNSGQDVTGEFVLRDTVEALGKVGTGLSGITGLDSIQIEDTAENVFAVPGDLTALVAVLDELDIDKVTVNGHISPKQAEALRDATAGKGPDGGTIDLVYDIRDTVAHLLGVREAQLALLNAAGDTDVIDPEVGK